MENYYEGQDQGMYIYGEGIWYTDGEDRIWMWWRDDSTSGFLGVSLSENGDRSWTEIMRSNFPGSGSRTFARRLNDGRFYQVGNSTRQLQDRNFFALSLSDNGTWFHTMVRLVAEPTRQRFAGHLKCCGYQYPSCVVDGDRLLVAHSVNKQDIEIGIIGISKLWKKRDRAAS